MIVVQILGETRVAAHGQVLGPRDLGGGKPRQVLEVLALRVGRPVTKDYLIDCLWGTEAPPGAVSTLEAYVSVLRRRLEPGIPARSSSIRTTNGGYLLDPDRVTVDVQQFREALAWARQAPPTAASPWVDDAMALAEFDLLESEPQAPWALDARASLASDVVSACADAGRRALSLGQWDEAARRARRALAVDPLAESCGRILIEALWRAGRRAESLREYDSLRRTLIDALGSDPDAATQQLHLAVLRDLGHERRAETTAGPLGSGPRRDKEPDHDEDELLERLVGMLVQAVTGTSRRRGERTHRAVARLAAELASA
jgi:DNA-binding SARP family transcriptional activator